MKRTAIAIAVALAAGAPAAFAGHDYDDYARVTDVDPQYERVNVPRKECYTEYEPQSYYRNEHRSLSAPSSEESPADCSAPKSARAAGRSSPRRPVQQ
jgi:hypothetical protein